MFEDSRGDSTATSSSLMLLSPRNCSLQPDTTGLRPPQHALNSQIILSIEPAYARSVSIAASAAQRYDELPDPCRPLAACHHLLESSTASATLGRRHLG
jgi:hypothetical protein